MDRTDDVNVENFFEKFSKSLRVRLSFSCIISVSLGKHRYSRSDRLPISHHVHIHRFTADEKDFSLSLEMTGEGNAD